MTITNRKKDAVKKNSRHGHTVPNKANEKRVRVRIVRGKRDVGEWVLE